jgi:hypothetical protein
VNQKEFLELLDFNPETGEMYWKTRPRNEFTCDRLWNDWNARLSGKQAFCTNSGHGYLMGRFNGKNYYAHRLAFFLFYGRWPDNIDHINHNRSDNRISNLREVSRQENQKNLRMPRDNKSGIVGVTWYKRRQKWTAYISIDCARKHLGYFDNKNDAIKARKDAEIRYGFHENHGRI